MFLRLVFLLTVIPFIEIYILVRVSQAIGFGDTLLLVLATGILGAWLLKKQGHSILMDLQEQGARGELPNEALSKGLFTFIGGLLLLTPGILTDLIGLSLIFPLTQTLWKNRFMDSWQRAVRNGHVQVFHSSTNMKRESSQAPHDPFSQTEPFVKRKPFNIHHNSSQNSSQGPKSSSVIDIKATSSTTVRKDEG